MKRVEMQSPASSGTVRVPEVQVAEFKARGWRLTEASKPKPAKKTAAAKKAAATDDDE